MQTNRKPFLSGRCPVSRSRPTASVTALVLVGLSLGLAGCFEAIIHNLVPLGGDTPGSRGELRVKFVNNTPYFVVFAFGIWDPLDEFSTPLFEQFLAQDDEPIRRLERNSTSPELAFPCARVISLGSTGFIEAIQNRTIDPEEDLSALRFGVTFTDKLLTDPTAQTFVINEFPNQEARIGIDFDCEEIVTFTFELDDTRPRGIRVDISTELIPEETDDGEDTEG